jgi:integrase
MEESAERPHLHTHEKFQQMGRGSGVRATSASSIGVSFVYKGVRCRERIALPPTSRNLKYVERLRATIEHEIATNTFDYARHFPDSPRLARLSKAEPGLSLGTAMGIYLDGLAGQVEPETLAKYRHDADAVAGWFPGRTLKTLTRADIRNQVASLNLSRKRLLNLLTPLRGALAQAVEDEIIETSPLAGFKVRRIAAPVEKIDPFTREEVDRLSQTELGYLWQFWAWTGPRSGELIGLLWSDVDSECESIQIRRSVRVGREKSPKTRAGKRRLVLLPEARAALRKQERRGDHEAVFCNPNTGERWHEDRGLARAFRKACEAANVRYRYPYQLRHTFASWALSSGENPLWVAKQMGHRDVTMIFKVYGRYMPDMNPEAGQKMSSFKGNIRAA